MQLLFELYMYFLVGNNNKKVNQSTLFLYNFMLFICHFISVKKQANWPPKVFHPLVEKTGKYNTVGVLLYLFLFIYLGFYIAFNTVQVISRRVVGRAEETSTHSLLGFCTVNCRPTASNY